MLEITFLSACRYTVAIKSFKSANLKSLIQNEECADSQARRETRAELRERPWGEPSVPVKDAELAKGRPEAELLEHLVREQRQPDALPAGEPQSSKRADAQREAQAD